MSHTLTIERVQALRRLTRAFSDLLRDELKAYLATLSPLFRPKQILGEYLAGSEREPVKGAERAFKELQALYDTVSKGKPYTLARDMSAPLNISSVALQLHSVEYEREAGTGVDARHVSIRQPLAWTLTYAGYGPSVLPGLLAARSRSTEELYDWIVHQLVLHSVLTHQPGLVDILSRLHFSVAPVTEAPSGAMPVIRVTSPLSTVRPPDNVIIQSVELSGMDAFEEVVNVDDVTRLEDPLKARLLDVARAHGELGA